MSKSCVGCKWMYVQALGWSNWTVEEEEVRCAKNNNPGLPADQPYDWNKKPNKDNWDRTREARCSLYAPGTMIWIPVEPGEEEGDEDLADDEEQAKVISEHSGTEIRVRKP